VERKTESMQARWSRERELWTYGSVQYQSNFHLVLGAPQLCMCGALLSGLNMGHAGDESTLQSASHGSSEQNDGDMLT
jgi:hypothetical protein